MPHFLYRALNADGRPVTGEVLAESLAQALAELERQGLTVQSLADQATRLPGNAPEERSGQAYEAEEDAAWRQQVVLVLERGRELLPPLRAYAEELPAGHRRRQLERLIATLSQSAGADTAAVLNSLPGYWIPLLGAATASRDPGRILREFLRESQEAENLRRQWRLALTYPLLLLTLAATVVVAFSFLVIPIFRDIFQGFGIRIPGLTLFILTVADWITSGRILLAALIVVLLGFGLVRATRFLSPTIRHWWGDRFATFARHSTAVARLTQFTADLLEADLAPQHALRLAGLASGSPALQRASARFAARLEGRTDATSAQDRRLLTHTVLYVLTTPQPTSTRICLLREISANHAERMRLRLSWTRGLIEPLAVCVVGLVVGVTALALFFPLINLLHGLT